MSQFFGTNNDQAANWQTLILWIVAIVSVSLLSTVASAQPAGEVRTLRVSDSGSVQYVFVVDDSGSMERNDPNRVAVFAVRSMLSMLPADDEVSVIRLNGHIDNEQAVPIQPLAARANAGDHRESLRRYLSVSSRAPVAQYAGSYTPCAGALDEVSRLLNDARSPGAPQVVFFLTDGACNQGDVHPDRWLESVDSFDQNRDLNELQFYALRFRGEGFTGQLGEIAETTGGTVQDVGIRKPTDIVEPFARALSRSRGATVEVLRPGSQTLAAHRGAKRVRLLAVASDDGAPLSIELQSLGGSPISATGDSSSGRHQWASSSDTFRYATADYRPGAEPVQIDVQNGGGNWKLIAVPEYHLIVDSKVSIGSCDAADVDVAQLRLGDSACFKVRLVNENGDPVTGDVSGEQNIEGLLQHQRPDGTSETLRNPSNEEDAIIEFLRPNVGPKGDHQFRPGVELGLGNERVQLWGHERSIPVSNPVCIPVPSRVELGELNPGTSSHKQFRCQGDFERRSGRLILSNDGAIPDCVSFALNDVPAGGEQVIAPEQTYTLSVSVESYCGPNSFNTSINSSLRLEFADAPGGARMAPVVIPISFTLDHRIEVPSEILIELQESNEQSVPITIGGNQERNLRFTALLNDPDEIDGWPHGDLDIGLTVGDERFSKGESLQTEWEVDRTAGGSSQLVVHASSTSCCKEGTYRTSLALIPDSGGEPIIVPVRVHSPDKGWWLCWGGTVWWVLAILLLILLLLYIYNTWRKTNLLDLDKLADRLTPLYWTRRGRPVINEQLTDRKMIRKRVRKLLPGGKRVKAWLGANPLYIGLPTAPEYDETVVIGLTVGDLPSHAITTLTPVSRRDAKSEIRKHSGNYAGRLFAQARSTGAVAFFAIESTEGAISGLQREGASRTRSGSWRRVEAEVEEVGVIEDIDQWKLIDQSARQRGDGMHAGWQIN